MSDAEPVCCSADNSRGGRAGEGGRRRRCRKLGGCELLTVAVGPLHVVLHVALLREADAAHLALEGLLASVLDHVDLQCALLVEGFVALSAFEGTFACKKKREGEKKQELNLFFLKHVPLMLLNDPTEEHSILFLLPSGHYLLGTTNQCLFFSLSN